MRQIDLFKSGMAVELDVLPKCSFCDKSAKFDSVCNVNMRSWANMCPAHYRQYGIGQLGTGYGQKLILKK